MAKILLVDDEEMLLDLGSTLLESMGHVSNTYINGLEALEALEAGSRWDAYILDNSMPEISGMELSSKIRELEINEPIIIVSGFLDHNLEEYVHSAKNISFLSKPFKRKDLTEYLDRVLTL